MCLVYNNGLDSSLEMFTPKNFRDIPVIYKHFWMAKNQAGLLKIFWNVDIFHRRLHFTTRKHLASAAAFQLGRALMHLAVLAKQLAHLFCLKLRNVWHHTALIFIRDWENRVSPWKIEFAFWARVEGGGYYVEGRGSLVEGRG